MEHGDAVVLRETRKQFIVYYLFGIFLVAWVIYLVLQGRRLSGMSFLLVAAIAAGSVVVPEMFRAWSRTIVTHQKVEVLSGILHKRHRNFFPNNISDIHVRQRLFQRVLNYGKITLTSQSQEISLGTVNDPHGATEKILAMLKK
ncbi:MAG TPA: PH domain-containing protein [Candidatus Nanoarchaeia archaeon]|nr:PH domain-containing protein [Candidatus Nanoarchaeia archaeon]